MTTRASEGDWVRIHQLILPPEERAMDLPVATRKVPLECWLNGFLAAPAKVGDEVEILTPAGRRAKGTLAEISPCYRHGFGKPQPVLGHVGMRLRSSLAGEGRVSGEQTP